MALDLLSLLIFKLIVSQLRINSNDTSQMKNNWKVLPFHINWKESCAEIFKDGSMGFRKYSSANGTANAMSGKSLMKIVERSLLFNEFRLLIKPHTTVTMRYGFKKECAYIHHFGAL
jgi:hypothetical protein